MPSSDTRPRLETWGGIECSLNRVGDFYFDQLTKSGHTRRSSDLDLFADLGITRLRYPLHWERHCSQPDHPPDWDWADARLAQLRDLRIEPIVGFVHHGSGPCHVDLTQNTFAEGLARYAGQVARRFPWVVDYTPVNEPLATARFSGLYGLWHPHGRSDQIFLKCLLVECRAIVLAMRAIREVNSSARLVQTEDLGLVHSTPALAYQADFENERRWLTWDLLAGRVDGNHPLQSYFRWAGIDSREIGWFADNPCPPDLVGVDYYVTSERFLDEQIDRYPAWCRGGNERHDYADVEAVRVCATGLAGLDVLLRQVWDRYGFPISITEAHLGCSREHQLRWLAEIWNIAREQRTKGVDVRSVTAWSLLGSYDWNSLLTRDAGHYEPGVFDLRGSAPRATALSQMVKDLAAGRKPSHPVLAHPGWWNLPERLLYPPVASHLASSLPERPDPCLSRRKARPILITGATGTLGQAFARVCQARGLEYRLLSRIEMDITNRHAVTAALDAFEPWAVINAAGFVRVDRAEQTPYACYRENSVGPMLLARACARRQTHFVTFSSDMVFDGQALRPYLEGDTVGPLNVYGKSKVRAERRVLEEMPAALVVRTSAFFGPWDRFNFVTRSLNALASGDVVSAPVDQTVSPTYVPDLVHACLDLLIDGACGLWHLSNRGPTTWFELARQAALRSGLDPENVRGCSTPSLSFAAQRPSYSVLESGHGEFMPPWNDALDRYLNECEVGYAARRSA